MAALTMALGSGPWALGQPRASRSKSRGQDHDVFVHATSPYPRAESPELEPKAESPEPPPRGATIIRASRVRDSCPNTRPPSDWRAAARPDDYACHGGRLLLVRLGPDLRVAPPADRTHRSQPARFAAVAAHPK